MDADTLEIFEASLERFSRERHGSARALGGAAHGDDPGLWKEMARLGWFELAVSASGPPERAPILALHRAAGEGLWREPLACAFGEAAYLLAASPAGALREDLRDGLASGERPLAYADREPGEGWDRGTPSTRIQRTPAGERLTGTKVAVVDSSLCAAYLVTAADGADVACFVVARDAPGLVVTRYSTLEGGVMADLRFDLTPGQRLCQAVSRQAAAAWGELLCAAECIGIMRGALAATRDFLGQRRQFGRQLIEFQVLQHRLADMAMLVRETDAMLREIAGDQDAGLDACSRARLALRAQVSRASLHVTREAIQLHGGMGITQECRVSHYYRRALTLDSLYGSEAWALARLANG